MSVVSAKIQTAGSDENSIFYDSIKQDRGWYFVEYAPPKLGSKFACLQLVVLDDTRAKAEIALSMEAELAAWIKRYPVPVLVSSFDSTGTLMSLDGCRASNHLMGYTDRTLDTVVTHWGLLSDKELPGEALNIQDQRRIFADIPFRSKQQLEKEALARAKRLRIGWWIVFVWAVLVPAGAALLEWWNDLLGAVVLVYGLFKAAQKALQLLGKWPESARKKEELAQLIRMRLHHYHCDRNPKGFERLKLENFEQDSREEIRREALSLKQSVKTGSKKT